jgi:hypothetical protein
MSEIAEALGSGESGSVIAGKIARSRARGDDRFQPRPHVRQIIGNKRLPPTAVPVPVPVPVPAPGPKPRLLINLGLRDCRMPVGAAPDGRHLMCGQPQPGRGPYCADCAAKISVSRPSVSPRGPGLLRRSPG